MDFRSVVATMAAGLIGAVIYELLKRLFARASRDWRVKARAFFNHGIAQNVIAGLITAAILAVPIQRWLEPHPGVNSGEIVNDPAEQSADDDGTQSELTNVPPKGAEEGVVDARSRDGAHVLYQAAKELRRLDVSTIGIVLGGTIRKGDAVTADLLHYSIKGDPYPEDESTRIHSSLPPPDVSGPAIPTLD